MGLSLLKKLGWPPFAFPFPRWMAPFPRSRQTAGPIRLLNWTAPTRCQISVSSSRDRCWMMETQDADGMVHVENIVDESTEWDARIHNAYEANIRPDGTIGLPQIVKDVPGSWGSDARAAPAGWVGAAGRWPGAGWSESASSLGECDHRRHQGHEIPPSAGGVPGRCSHITRFRQRQEPADSGARLKSLRARATNKKNVLIPFLSQEKCTYPLSAGLRRHHRLDGRVTGMQISSTLRAGGRILEAQTSRLPRPAFESPLPHHDRAAAGR